MKRYTIAQKMSNTGSIHDLASDQHDRVIEFRGAAKYAVILAAYYGGRGYTSHATEAAACRQARRLSKQDYSYGIINADGRYYTETPWGELQAWDELQAM